MSPLLVFGYGLALAGGAFAIGLALLLLWLVRFILIGAFRPKE